MEPVVQADPGCPEDHGSPVHLPHRRQGTEAHRGDTPALFHHLEERWNWDPRAQATASLSEPQKPDFGLDTEASPGQCGATCDLALPGTVQGTRRKCATLISRWCHYLRHSPLLILMWKCTEV